MPTNVACETGALSICDSYISCIIYNHLSVYCQPSKVIQDHKQHEHLTGHNNKYKISEYEYGKGTALR